jgi:hypothetical protein
MSQHLSIPRFPLGPNFGTCTESHALKKANEPGTLGARQVNRSCRSRRGPMAFEEKKT